MKTLGAASNLAVSPGWAACLDIDVVCDGNRTHLRHAEHRGPLRIQRPFYPEGERIAHLYLLHPPGGLVGGDRLDIAIRVGEDAELLVTTPAAQKIYRSPRHQSTQAVALGVAAGGALEWLPSETIFFDGAQTRLATTIELGAGAAFIGWDIGCFGRPASGLAFSTGRVRQELTLRRRGELSFAERTQLDGGSAVLGEAFGYAGFPSYGTLYSASATGAELVEQVAAVRAVLAGFTDRPVAVTGVDGVLIVRVLAPTVELVREPLLAAWACLRPARPPISSR